MQQDESAIGSAKVKHTIMLRPGVCSKLSKLASNLARIREGKRGPLLLQQLDGRQELRSAGFVKFVEELLHGASFGIALIEVHDPWWRH